MLLPEPVGATDRTSRPASIAATTSDCPGLKASSPKTSLSVRSALSIIPTEFDGICRRDQRLLTAIAVESGHCRSSHRVTGRKNQERKRMAKYMFLQYVDESKAPRPGSPELNAVIDAFAKYLDEVKAAGVFHDGDPCQPSAATFSVTVQGGHAHTTDGPMHSASPWLNGFFVLDCKDRADAEAWAAKNPAAKFGGTIEVHPILTLM